MSNSIVRAMVASKVQTAGACTPTNHLGLADLARWMNWLSAEVNIKRQDFLHRVRAPQEPGPLSYTEVRGGSRSRMHSEMVHKTASGERRLSSFQPFLQKFLIHFLPATVRERVQD